MIVITTAITPSLKASSRLRLMVDRSSRSGEGASQHSSPATSAVCSVFSSGFVRGSKGGETGGNQPDRDPERRAERVGDQWRRHEPGGACGGAGMGCPSLLLFRSSGSRGFIGPASHCRLHEARRRLGRGARKATGTLARSGRRLRTCALLAGNGLRVDEGRELVLELLDSAGTPALGQ